MLVFPSYGNKIYKQQRQRRDPGTNFVDSLRTNKEQRFEPVVRFVHFQWLPWFTTGHEGEAAMQHLSQVVLIAVGLIVIHHSFLGHRHGIVACYPLDFSFVNDHAWQNALTCEVLQTSIISMLVWSAIAHYLSVDRTC
jgi:hypothetical protein